MSTHSATTYDVVERSVDIPVPPSVVAAYITDLRRWQEWSPWEEMDPKLSRSYSGPESGVGAAYQWSGNRRAGAGNMLITQVSDQAIVIDVTFTRPFKSRSESVFVLAATSTGTHLVWRMRMPRTRLTKALTLVYRPERMLGPDLEKGLASLTEVAQV